MFDFIRGETRQGNSRCEQAIDNGVIHRRLSALARNDICAQQSSDRIDAVEGHEVKIKAIYSAFGADELREFRIDAIEADRECRPPLLV
ncbi:hypothetical protein EFP18_05330 [Burkholderia glumae]|nr:hypothetical protein EFP18_05330 [Burkholderia glumae]